MLRLPVDPHRAIEALVGLPRRTSRQVVGAATAGSAEAGALLEAMPRLIRNLSISTVTVPERCTGEIRGPVLWSETLSARAASAGDPGVFVCATVSRAYDTPANRLLVTALDAIVRGGRDVERFRDGRDEEPELLHDARHHADLAQRYLDHRTLINVRPEPVRRRATHRSRRTLRRRSYAPVAAMLRRAATPLDVDTIRLFCNPTTTARHDLLVAAIDHLVTRGVRVPVLLLADHEVVGGPLRYRHPAIGSRADRHRAGLFIGSTRFDVAGGAGRDDSSVVVRNRTDLTRGIDDVILREGL